MLCENLGAERNGFLRGNGAVRPNFDRKLVIVGNLPDTGILSTV